MNSALAILKERGFFQQCTDEGGLADLLTQGPLAFYIGIDPTGPSCHIGHLVPIYAAAHLQKAGHIPIVLMGGGTALIGDPSGKTEMRQMIGAEEVSKNISAMRPQLGRLIDFAGSNARVENNADWLTPLAYIDFLRDIGRHFSVNRMLTFEAYRQRMERGLSFLEFNYQLLQAYDFLELYRRHNCLLQIGGDDQWGNIVAGMELIRRVESASAYGLTFPLITRSDGKKMGKTEQGALFLDPALTPVYDFYQYWRNVPDEDVGRFFLLFTFLEADECRALGTAADINASKERLAFEITQLLHGEAEAESARAAAKAMFQGGGAREGMPTTEIASAKLAEGISVTELFTLTGLCSSRSEARRLIQQGGAQLNGEKVSDFDALVDAGLLKDGEIILKAGKKRFHRVCGA
ncbi:MAG: tyrosine--tRNA ligase [Spirochaeta sp. LUC14_002_19_P3]|nr:MAG: tyrosine--tRNA ligase [Spirochaeta sp. LUC14_002_19_P3]